MLQAPGNKNTAKVSNITSQFSLAGCPTACWGIASAVFRLQKIHLSWLHQPRAQHSLNLSQKQLPLSRDVEIHDVSKPNAVYVARLALDSPEILLAIQRGSRKRRVWQ